MLVKKWDALADNFSMDNPMTTDVAKALYELCDVFDEELRCQEDVLAVCRAQETAVLEHDTEAVNARTRALELLVEEAARAEMRRHRLLRPLVKELGLPFEHQTLSHLIEVVNAPWKSRMREFQARLRTVTDQTKAQVKRNAALLRESMRHVDRSLSVLAPECAPGKQPYTNRGAEGRPGIGNPVLVDQKG